MVCARLMHKKNTSKDCDKRDTNNNNNDNNNNNNNNNNNEYMQTNHQVLVSVLFKYIFFSPHRHILISI